MLIAAATKAPDEPSESAKLVWDNYYANHQNNQAFRKLKVADSWEVVPHWWKVLGSACR
jgi:hypothetical protein